MHAASLTDSIRSEETISTYAFMRWLESTPSRYDRGMRLLSRGRVADRQPAAAT